MDNRETMKEHLMKEHLMPVDKMRKALSMAEYICANNIPFTSDTDIKFAVDKQGKIFAFCIPDENDECAVYFCADDVKMHRDAPAHIVCQDMFLFRCQFDAFYHELSTAYEATKKKQDVICEMNTSIQKSGDDNSTKEPIKISPSNRASELIRKLHEKDEEKALKDAAIAHAEMLNKIAPYNEKINDLIFIGRAMQAVGAPVIWADIDHIGFTDFEGGTEEDALGEVAKLGMFTTVHTDDAEAWTVRCVTMQAGDVNYAVGNKDALSTVEKMLSQLADFENAVYKTADEWLAKR